MKSDLGLRLLSALFVWLRDIPNNSLARIRSMRLSSLGCCAGGREARDDAVFRPDAVLQLLLELGRRIREILLDKLSPGSIQLVRGESVKGSMLGGRSLVVTHGSARWKMASCESAMSHNESFAKPKIEWKNLAATPSNCGDTLKLHLPSSLRKQRMARVTTFGYGKNDEDCTMGNPQPSPSVCIAHAD